MGCMKKPTLIRPFIVFNAEYENAEMNREGISNAYDLMKEVMFQPENLYFDGKPKSIVIKDGDRSDVIKQFRKFLDSIDVESEILLFYYCGHGCIDYSAKKLYLAMHDSDFAHIADNAIAAEAIEKMIKENQVKYYAVIFDCCHADMFSMGAGKAEISSISLEEYKELQGGVFIPSSDASEVRKTYEIEGKEYAAFSYYFFMALKEGFPDAFRKVSFENLYLYVKTQLEKHNLILPPVTQKGELYKLPIWKNQAFKGITTNYMAEKDNSKTLKVVLVKSAIEHPIKLDDFGIPLGLWVLKDYIEKYGADIGIDIYDERLALQEADVNKRQSVLDNFESIIEKYDVVGLSMSSSEVAPALKKLKIAKDMGKITTAGGIFTSSNEEYLLSTGVVDYVTPGIGTTALKNLLEWILKQKEIKLRSEKKGKDYSIKINNEIPGVATKDNLQEFFIPTDMGLSNMSFATWKQIIDEYKPYLFDKNLNLYKADIFSSRGCRGTCTFCSVQKECGRNIIKRPIYNVIQEVRFLYDNGFRYFSLKDEDCLDDKDRFLEFLNEVQLPGIRFKIRTRVDRLLDKKDLLERLAKMGVTEIQYGVESSDYMLLNKINKGIKKKQIDKVKSFIISHADLNITANCSFILGLPEETEEYYGEMFLFIKDIYDLSHNCKPKIYINFFTPHPRNSRFEIADDFKMITEDLNYFTHKYPVGFYEPISGNGAIIRGKMIETYEKIIEYTNSTRFNPSLCTEPVYEHLDKFKMGNRYIKSHPVIPKYV